MGKGGEGSGDGAKVEEENMAAWLVSVNTLKIQPFRLPSLGPYDVRVRMKAVGICGSDVHYLKTLRCAHFVVKEPMVIGHECAGVIEEVGSEVESLVVGDRVALEPGISCWRCKYCKGGRYNLCPDMKFFATPPVHGSLVADYKIPLYVFHREVDVVGIFRYKETWPLCIEFLRSGKIDVKPLITHRFGFSQEEVVEAFEVSARGGDAIKVMFNL